MSTYVLVCVCVSVCGMYVMLCYVMLFYYIYIYIRVCMPARAQEGGGGDAGVEGVLRCVGGEGGKAEHNIIQHNRAGPRFEPTYMYVHTYSSMQYIYICVCMPALAQEGGGEDAGGDGGLGWVGREGGETEQNVI